MNPKKTLISLYYLLVNADGNVNEREIAAGRQMIQAENISEFEFDTLIELLKKRSTKNIYDECLESLRTQTLSTQIRFVAWLCVVANADGFMDKTEWQFIYGLYCRELRLPLDEIMKAQKDLIMVKEKPNKLISVL